MGSYKLSTSDQAMRPPPIKSRFPKPLIFQIKTRVTITVFPDLHAQLLLLAVRKAGGRPGQIYHMIRAAADDMFNLLTSGFVLSPSLFFP